MIILINILYQDQREGPDAHTLGRPCQCALEQGTLLRLRPAELAGIQELALAGIETEALAGNVETVTKQLRELPFPSHAAAEFGVVFAPSAHGAYARHHMLGLERIVPLQP